MTSAELDHLYARVYATPDGRKLLASWRKDDPDRVAKIEARITRHFLRIGGPRRID
jgi:hypothetical protein